MKEKNLKEEESKEIEDTFMHSKSMNERYRKVDQTMV